jgi:hypothetical protein
METVDLQAVPGPVTVVRFLEVLVPIPAPAPYVVVTALKTVRENNILLIPARPEVLILFVADAARRHLFVNASRANTGDGGVGLAVASCHERCLLST